MRTGKYPLLIGVVVLLLLSPSVRAQNPVNNRYEEYKKQVRQMVSYLESCLNLLGDEQTDMADKDIIINQSYTKIFRDAKVQIEDDLDEGRRQPMNKEVQAYLKDVDFFYRHAEFKLDIQDISWYMNANNQVYYKVTLLRTLKGTDIEGRTVNNSRQRFIEINLDEQKQDLKIASYYTTKVTETEDLFAWWESLPLEWKQYFGKDIQVADNVWLGDVLAMLPNVRITDSVKVGNQGVRLSNQRTVNALKKLINTEQLTLSGQKFFTDVNALSKFTELKKLDLSHTLVASIEGLRSCSKLEDLDISHTAVKDLEPLKYLPGLQHLDCSQSLVTSISPLVYLPGLTNLKLSATFITDIGDMQYMPGLTQLNLYNTRIKDLGPLSGLEKLQWLDIAKTDVENLQALEKLQTLQRINIENTAVQSLDPLKDLGQLQLVYADGARLTRDAVRQFMLKKPGCQVIYESGELSAWWNSLSMEWKNIFANYTGGASQLSKEQLHDLIRLRELDISFLPVTDLSGLRYLTGLEKLVARQVRLNDLHGLERLTELQYLDLTGTIVTDYSALRPLQSLHTLILNQTGFDRLAVLDSLHQLSRLEIEQSRIPLQEAMVYESAHPNVTVIYRSKDLRQWWSGLPAPWREYFIRTLLYSEPTDDDLHALVRRTQLTVQDELKISGIGPLALFTDLKELTISGTSVSDFSSLTQLRNLEKLRISRNPVSDLSFLYSMPQLTELDLSSLRIYEAEFLQNLQKLEVLNLSNTPLKSIAPLTRTYHLRYLDISNTQVKNLRPLKELVLLDNLICFNTGLKENSIRTFRKWRPSCNVIFY